MTLKADCLLSPNQSSQTNVSKAIKEEEQLHAVLMHDVGKGFQRFLVELDIYVKLTVIVTDETDIYVHTKRNLDMEIVDWRLQGIIHQYTVILIFEL